MKRARDTWKLGDILFEKLRRGKKERGRKREDIAAYIFERFFDFFLMPSLLTSPTFACILYFEICNLNGKKIQLMINR